MTTIQKVTRRVQAVAGTHIPKKLHPRFLTGIEALSTKALSSLNANGRSVSANRWTGETRMRRTVTEERFPKLLLTVILKEFLPKTGMLRLSLDHSTFGKFTLAVFAISAGKGRALPVWCIVTRAGKGNKLLKPLLRGFKVFLEQLSYQQRKRIVVVMDRWFVSPDLLDWLDGNGLKFVVRLRADIPVGVPWVEPYLTIPAGEVSLPDTPVTYHGYDWRLVRSDLKPDMKEPEPWFLLTNIPEDKRSRRQTLNTYAKRFEIEEHFKDIKWIEGYEWHQIRQAAVAKTVFMFVFLGWWLLLKARHTINQPVTHPKKQLSWFRAIWEAWQQMRTQPLFLTG